MKDKISNTPGTNKTDLNKEKQPFGQKQQPTKGGTTGGTTTGGVKGGMTGGAGGTKQR